MLRFVGDVDAALAVVGSHNPDANRPSYRPRGLCHGRDYTLLATFRYRWMVESAVVGRFEKFNCFLLPQAVGSRDVTAVTTDRATRVTKATSQFHHTCTEGGSIQPICGVGDG